MKAHDPPSRSAFLLAATLIVLILIAYAPVLRSGFIWDDDYHLTRNPCIIGPLGFKEIWTLTRAIYYPLVLTNFWVLHKLFGLNPLPFHLLNILMHGASAVLLWRVLVRLKIHGGWFGAALWALHPVMVQSVAWITELKNTQSCFFFLLSILFFLEGDDARSSMAWTSESRRNFGFSLLFFVMAVTSKPSTVMLPFVLALCLWWRRCQWQWCNLSRLAPFILISLLASGWTIWEQEFPGGARGANWSQSLLERFAIAGLDVWFYLGKIVWPHSLIFIYPRWNYTQQLIAVLPALIVVGCLFFLWSKRNGFLRPLFFAATYFVISLFPVLGFFNVYFFKFSFVSDHFQYLASIGAFALIASVGTRACERLFSGHIQRILLVIILVTLMTLTWRQVLIYQDSETLWTKTIHENPQAWIAHNNLSEPLLARGDFKGAAEHALVALNLHPDYALAHNNLGLALEGLKQNDAAMKEFRRAIELDPKLPQARLNLAGQLLAEKDFDGAEREYAQVIATTPEFAEAHYNYAVLLAMRRRIPEALRECRAAYALTPKDPQCQWLLDILIEAGNKPQ